MSQYCKTCGCDFDRTPPIDGCCSYCGHEVKKDCNNPDHEERLLTASKMRNAGRFDEARIEYNLILNDCPDNDRAIWGRLLCKYGVVYIEKDNEERVLTCRKALKDQFSVETDYRMACKLASDRDREQYIKDAERISDIQNAIVRLQDTNYDIFLCYKETEQVGGIDQPTLDSGYVTEIYQALDGKYDVFFARVSLQDKGGADYDAEIFNAIEKCRVMIVFGSSADYFTSTWVQSEWSRFLESKKSAKAEKMLIPMLKGVDPYKLPAEFKNQRLQALFFDTERKKGYKGLRNNLKKIFHEELKLASKNDIAREAMIKIEDGDIEKGMKLLKQQSRGKNPAEALYLLASLEYEKQEEDSVKEAFKLFKKAADKGYKEAAFQVGFMYDHGIGVSIDQNEADRYFDKYKVLSKMEELNIE